MEFKAGDRVHVTRLDWGDVDFYATLKPAHNPHIFHKLKNCSNSDYENERVWNERSELYGKNKKDYYTLATDEEDTEEPVIQRTTDTHDPVNKPSHYMLGDIEVKDIIAIVADKYHKGSVAHNVASALEYQMRAPEKNGLEDIKKARKCLDFAIENWE
ncbi:DUF3310 domain-containing protein [Mammaliicoccus sciuri]|uniref:DUF3310 domain-containing protein n=1 Tax=Mammaliicoccus sciuri TaxID=1296 RepID=UPI003F5711F2